VVESITITYGKQDEILISKWCA